jgi:hypothetical protein
LKTLGNTERPYRSHRKLSHLELADIIERKSLKIKKERWVDENENCMVGFLLSLF